MSSASPVSNKPPPLKTRYYYDTEFNEEPGYLDLISIGMKCEDGREFYAVSAEFDLNRCNDFVRTHVLPKLGNVERESRAQIRDRLLAFVGKTRPEWWAYFADYDHVLPGCGSTFVQGEGALVPVCFGTSEQMHVSEEAFQKVERDSQATIASLLMGRLSLL